MKRKIVIVLLAMGTVLGFAAGFAHLGRHVRGHHDAFERHVAQICVEAARNAPASR